MKRRQKRRIVWLVALLLLLSLLGLWYWNFKATKKITIDLTATAASDTVAPPTYLFSFAAGPKDHLARPVGVLVADGNVYVSDSEQGLIFEFRQDGTFVRTFGKGKLQTPAVPLEEP